MWRWETPTPRTKRPPMAVATVMAARASSRGWWGHVRITAAASSIRGTELPATVHTTRGSGPPAIIGTHAEVNPSVAAARMTSTASASGKGRTPVERSAMSRPMRIADYLGVNRCAASAHSLRGPPHRVFGCRIAVPSRPREQTALDEELKELLVLESRRPFGHLTLGEKERRRSVSRPGVAHGLSATDEVEGILVLGAGKRVEGVASFAAKVATLR